MAEGPVKVVSLLSDYGLADGFVGTLHSVLRSSLPGVPIVDLTHDIPPQDVRAGSLALQRAAPYLAPGVVLAVVDPGVGGRRRSLVVEASGAGVVFVGPDNGLLLPAVRTLGGPRRVVELQDRGYWLPSRGRRSPGATSSRRQPHVSWRALTCRRSGSNSTPSASSGCRSCTAGARTVRSRPR